jgi:hypothetical protein
VGWLLVTTIALTNAEKQARWQRRALKPTTPKEMKAIHKEAFRQEQVEWLREHPGKDRQGLSTAVDRRPDGVGCAKEPGLAAERQAWERDHPGEQYPEHLCGLSDADYVRYQRWRKGRRPRRAKGRWRTIGL